MYIHSNNHAGYYPNAKTIDLKLMFDPQVGCGWLVVCFVGSLWQASLAEQQVCVCMRAVPMCEIE